VTDLINHFIIIYIIEFFLAIVQDSSGYWQQLQFMQ